MSGMTRWAAIVPFLALPLAACDDTSGVGGTGRVSILLTDAPGDVVAAVVTIEGVYLQRSTSTRDDEELPPAGDDADRVWLLEEPLTTNLLELQHDVADLVVDATVPAGHYSQLRFVVSDAYLQIEDGRIFASSADYGALPPEAQDVGELQIPSGTIRVVIPGGVTVEDGADLAVLADFDVAQSFGHAAGHSNRWVMHPVIKATRIEDASGLLVRLTLASGVTLPVIGGTPLALDQFRVRVRDAAGNVEGAAVQQAGAGNEFQARFRYVQPANGPFDVDLVLPAGVASITTEPALPIEVTVTEGSTTELSITITGLTAS